MLLKSVSALNSRGTQFDMVIGQSSNGIKVISIDGLDPVTATISSSTFGTEDGEQFHSARRQKRNIKISLGLNPNFAVTDVETLRQQVYAYFMPKSQVQMTFKMFDRFSNSVLGQNKNLTIVGRVESCETNLFTKDSQMDISILCFDPDFVDPTVTQLDEFTNNDNTFVTFPYDGTTESGIVLSVAVDRTLAQFTIEHIPPSGIIRVITFGYPMIAGDVIDISSVPKSKYAKLTRSGVQSSVLYGLVTPQAGWVTLEQGNNQFGVYAAGAAIPYTISYTNKYGGL